MTRWGVLEIRNAPNGNKVIRKATIVIDWNNTLVNESWDGPYTFIDGAVEALHDFMAQGYRVKVHSLVLHSKDFDEVAPCDSQKRAKNFWYMRDALDNRGLQEVEIITDIDKIPCVWNIDDKNIHFGGNWRKVVRKVERGM